MLLKVCSLRLLRCGGNSLYLLNISYLNERWNKVLLCIGEFIRFLKRTIRLWTSIPKVIFFSSYQATLSLQTYDWPSPFLFILKIFLIHEFWRNMLYSIGGIAIKTWRINRSKTGEMGKYKIFTKFLFSIHTVSRDVDITFLRTNMLSEYIFLVES